MNEIELTALFRDLGAPDPEAWARSQVREGIPQLARYLFLRQAWRTIVSEDESHWIEQSIARSKTHPDEPYAGVGLGLARLKALGASDDDITDVVRGIQAELLFDFCYLLGDPGDLEPEVAGVSWRVVQMNDQDEIVGSIDALHESVLATDPTGREMRPRPSAE